MSSSSPNAPERPTTFVVALVVGAAVVASIIGYLGVAGQIGGGITGGTIPGSGSNSPAPAVCEGRAISSNFTFSFVGGASSLNQWMNFNGSVPGPCVEVGNGSNVTVHFSVGAQSTTNHSWVLIESDGNATSLPAFPGAGFSNGTRFTGLAPGDSASFHFEATKVGSYRYICEMPGHYLAGMWGWFNVTSSSAKTIDAAGPGTSSAATSSANGPTSGLGSGMPRVTRP